MKNGKTVIITGSAKGLGSNIALLLAKEGHNIIINYFQSKNEAKLLGERLAKITSVKIIKGDVSKFQDTQTIIQKTIKEFGSVDILINNAGIMACPETRINKEWESQFAVNQIGHFLLTRELMNSMKRAKESRLVSLSSSAHSISGIIWDDIHFKANPYDKWIAYGQSKTASSLLAIEFNRLMNDHGGKGFAVHPGGIMTPLQRHLPIEEMVALGWVKEDGSPSDLAANFFKSTTQGASTSLWCATSPMLDSLGGVFCENCDIAERKVNLDESMLRYFGAQVPTVPLLMTQHPSARTLKMQISER